MPTKHRSILIATRGATKEEEANFSPRLYFRLVKRCGWRSIELEIDKNIDIPNSEPIPVQIINIPGSFNGTINQMTLLLYWSNVLFEYRGQIFYGQMKL